MVTQLCKPHVVKNKIKVSTSVDKFEIIRTSKFMPIPRYFGQEKGRTETNNAMDTVVSSEIICSIT